MKLFPQVSTVTGFLDIPQQGSYPQISTREANTSLRTKSGETVMIGGLLRDEEIKNIERVPILSKIPFFGELFTRRKTTRNKSQVVISITPTIIQGEP
jgi:type II secretory pathway component GspD/PulD (secretin)